MTDHGRFAPIFAGNEPAALWDTVIHRDDDVVVVPTRGSILPHWFLLVPQTPHLNFARAHRSGVSAPLTLLRRTVERLGAVNRWIWFEHGAAEVGSVVGCGVDHAHLHLLIDPPFNLSDFASMTSEASGRAWLEADAGDGYANLSGERSYYAFGDAETAYLLDGANLGSQFFRKVVANLAGRPTEWDYKVHDGLENVVSTLTHFLPSTAIAA